MNQVQFSSVLNCQLISISIILILSSDETTFLQVTIPDSPPVSAILGGSLTLPCLVSLSRTPSLGRHAVLTQPRVKWSFLSSNKETEILVARGERVKVSELYKGRASLLNYAASSADLTLRLDGLIHNDTGFYRCEVQHGLEDAHDQAQVKVKGDYYVNSLCAKITVATTDCLAIFSQQCFAHTHTTVQTFGTGRISIFLK